MSFGFSPSDIVKLAEISTRVYIAFKGMSLPIRPKTLLVALINGQMPTRTLRRRWKHLFVSFKPSHSVFSSWTSS